MKIGIPKESRDGETRVAATPETVKKLIAARHQVIVESDLLILCAPHAVYAKTDFKGKPVFDVWGHIQDANVLR